MNGRTKHKIDTITTIGIGDVRSPMIIALKLYCAADERREFVHKWGNEILKQARLAGLDPDDPNFTLLECSLESCGGQAIYRTASDVPLVDIPCPCGDPNHWLIKWTEPANNRK